MDRPPIGPIVPTIPLLWNLAPPKDSAEQYSANPY